jgi:hypothetical protein
METFWTTRIGAINWLSFVTLLFLSGQVVPLDLMPTPARSPRRCCRSAGWSPSRLNCFAAG